MKTILAFLLIASVCFADEIYIAPSPESDDLLTNAWHEGRIDALEEGVAGNGLISGGSVSTNQGGLGISVAAGTIQYEDTSYTFGALTGLVSTADGSNPRWDLVSVNTSSNVVVTAGTASSEPVPPPIPANNVALAIVSVPASDTEISSDQFRTVSVVVDQVVSTTIESHRAEVLITNITLAAAGELDFTSIPQTYDDLILRIRARSDQASLDNCIINLNNDTTAGNYVGIRANAQSTAWTVSSSDGNPVIGKIPGTGDPSGVGVIEVLLPDYTGANHKQFESSYSARASAVYTMGLVARTWTNTAAITRITIYTDNDPTDELTAGSKGSLYGVTTKSVVTQ